MHMGSVPGPVLPVPVSEPVSLPVSVDPPSLFEPLVVGMLVLVSLELPVVVVLVVVPLELPVSVAGPSWKHATQSRSGAR